MKKKTAEVYPLRRGFVGVAAQELIDAVRRVIADWDGGNWVAVRHVLEVTDKNADLDTWTMSDIRQRFAIAQRPIILQLGGKVNTTEASITRTEWNDGSDDSGWPTITEVSKRFGKNRGTIFLWLERGDLRDNGQSGTARRIDPASILEYCTANGLVYNVDSDHS